MSFSTSIKEEITKNEQTNIDYLLELSAYVRYTGVINKNIITLTMENASVARRIYKDIKNNFGINIQIKVRIQKRFRVKQIYILEIKEKVNEILDALNIIRDGKKIYPDEFFIDTPEEKASFIRGAFLACGSINNPSTSGYHLEFTTNYKQDGIYISKLLKDFNIISKVIKRNNKYMTYVKSAEMISDTIKLLGAINSFFYFEDIRIYRDHKNMVNRLNNCEIANQEKTFKAGMQQLENINYLKENDLFDLLDEKTSIVANYRVKYPESSLQELADIITSEEDYKIGKSGINHHFIKINELVKKHKGSVKK